MKIKTSLQRKIDEYRAQGYVCVADAALKMNCSKGSVKTRLGEPDLVLRSGGVKSFLYHVSRLP